MRFFLILKIVLFQYFCFSELNILAQDQLLNQHPQIRNQAVNAIAIDAQNNKWIGTAQGLIKLEKDTFQLFDPGIQSDSYTESSISCIQLAKNFPTTQTIWLGTYRSAILRMDSTGKFNYFDFSNLGNFLVTSLTEDKDGKIWAGTAGKGILTVDLLNGKSYYSTQNSKILSNRVFAIHADRFGDKWIGTSKGLCRIRDNEKWESFKIDGQITSIKEFQNSLWIIAVDDEGSKIWKYENFENWIELPVPSSLKYTRVMDFDINTYGNSAFVSNQVAVLANGNPTTYGKNQGFQSNSGLCIKFDNQGIIWIGTEGAGLFHTPFTSTVLPKKAPKTLDDLFSTDSIDSFLEIPVPLRIGFNRGSSELLITSEPELERVAQLLQKFPNLKLRLVGHTDNIGDPDKNLALSERRAIAVKGYLVQQKQVSADRITCLGYGGQRPVADNSQEHTRRLNRRVELILHK